MPLATPQPAILIVDDDTAILAILKRFLRDVTSDYELIAVSDPTAALLPLQAGLVRLMISDVTLGEMDGLQLTELAKRIAPSTRILLLTGVAD
jgi:DNA-binding NtrC family response regulator